MITEHVDPLHMKYVGIEQCIHEVLITIAANQNRAYAYAKSSAGARGLPQFIENSYQMVRDNYPKALLEPNFRARHERPAQCGTGFDLAAGSRIDRSAAAHILDRITDSSQHFVAFLAAGYNRNPARVAKPIIARAPLPAARRATSTRSGRCWPLPARAPTSSWPRCTAAGQLVGAGRHRVALSRAASFAVRRAAGLDARTVSSFFRVYRAGDPARAATRPRRRFIREGGFACKAEILVKLDRARRPRRGGPGRPRRSRRVGESKLRVLPTMGGYARLMARQRTRPPGARRAMTRAERRHHRRRPARPGTAYRLAKAGVAVTVYERDAQLGGLAGTVRPRRDPGRPLLPRRPAHRRPRARRWPREVGLGDDAFRFRRTRRRASSRTAGWRRCRRRGSC